jgi:hypothetical protein
MSSGKYNTTLQGKQLFFCISVKFLSIYRSLNSTVPAKMRQQLFYRNCPGYGRQFRQAGFICIFQAVFGVSSLKNQR